MAILLTGAAGFIGMHTALKLLGRGDRVVGIDSLNACHDPALNRARLARLRPKTGFRFERLDFSDPQAMDDLLTRYPEIDRIVHLGARAGVRASADRPFDYLDANIRGQLVILETCRRLADRPSGLRNFVYASSSSVYGASTQQPSSTSQRTDRPVSFYGATKKAAETMTETYTGLYGFPAVGLRLFTVYGPWGRPDMSPYIFTRRILGGEPIEVFNNGQMKRDFTYIDDIVEGTVAALDRPEPARPHRIYNLGNSTPIPLLDYIRCIEAACNTSAILDFRPMQPGDVPETHADITASRRDLGYSPETPIEVGIPRFVDWFRTHHCDVSSARG